VDRELLVVRPRLEAWALLCIQLLRTKEIHRSDLEHPVQLPRETFPAVLAEVELLQELSDKYQALPKYILPPVLPTDPEDPQSHPSLQNWTIVSVFDLVWECQMVSKTELILG
jgi:hypothetical protein